MLRLNAVSKTALLILLSALVVIFQYEYDATKTVLPASFPGSLNPEMVRLVDMGFHSSVASALWVSTMPEVLDLFRNQTEYFSDLSYLNAVDPKLSYPYAFSVLILPATPYPTALDASFEIGKQGIANGDPDWRIPYYMALNYYLGLKDKKDAITYFDLAAHTPGVPGYAERFALNFGIGTNERETIKQLWTTIRDSTNDLSEKARAQAYVDRLDDLDYLEAAAKVYKQQYGAYPASPDDLVKKGIIPEVPQDPLGFTFIINTDGTAGIDLVHLPAYINAAPQD